MAFERININPIDLDDSAAVGVNLPFKGPAVFISNYQTKDAIRNNLINFFLTDPGERYLNPTFGGGLREFIFSQITSGNIEFLKEDINTKLNAYFPNVEIVELNVTANPDFNRVNISLNYRVINTNIEDEINITIDG